MCRGIYTQEGKVIAAKPQYVEIKASMNRNTILAEKQGGVGLLDSLGNILLPFEYQTLSYPQNGFICATISLVGVVDSIETIKANKPPKISENPFENDFCLIQNKQYQPVWQTEAQWIRIRDKKIMWRGTQWYPSSQDDGCITLTKKGEYSQMGIIDTSGRWIIPVTEDKKHTIAGIINSQLFTLTTRKRFNKSQCYLVNGEGKQRKLSANSKLIPIKDFVRVERQHSFPHYSLNYLMKLDSKNIRRPFYLWNYIKGSDYKDFTTPFRNITYGGESAFADYPNVKNQAFWFGKYTLFTISSPSGKKWSVIGTECIKGEDFYICVGKTVKAFDENGKIISPRKYDDVVYSSDGAIFTKGKEKIRIFTQDKPTKTSSTLAFTEKKLQKKDDTYGYTDSLTGKNVIPFTYQSTTASYNLPFFILRQDLKYGLKDSNGHEILAPIYLQIKRMQDSLYFLQLSTNSWEVADKEGKIMPNIQFNSYEIYTRNYGKIAENRYKESLFFLGKGQSINMYRPNGKLLLANFQAYLKVDWDSRPDNHCFYIEQNGKKGVFDSWLGKWVIAPDYDTLSFHFPSTSQHHPPLKPVCFAAKKKNSKFTDLYDEKGILLLSEEIADIDFPTEELLPYKNSKGKWGAINWKGEKVIPCRYDLAYDIIKGTENFYYTQNDIYNHSGKRVFKYRKADKILDRYNFFNAYIIHNKINKTQIINAAGKKVLTLNNDVYIPFDRDIVGIRGKDKYALLNTHSWIFMSEYIYDDVQELEDDKMLVLRNGKYSLLDSNAKPLFELSYDTVIAVTKSDSPPYFHAKNKTSSDLYDEKGQKCASSYDFYQYPAYNMCTVALNGKVGVWDIKQQKCLIEPEYEGIKILNPHIFAPKKDCKYGIMNREGKLLQPYIFDNVEPIGAAFLVSNNEQQGLIDSTGKSILPCEYDKITTDQTLFILSKDKKKGITDAAGNIILPVEYEECYFLIPPYLIVQKNDKQGLFDNKGTQILPFEYDTMREEQESVFSDSHTEILLKKTYISLKKGNIWTHFYDK